MDTILSRLFLLPVNYSSNDVVHKAVHRTLQTTARSYRTALERLNAIMFFFWWNQSLGLTKGLAGR